MQVTCSDADWNICVMVEPTVGNIVTDRLKTAS